MGSPSPSSSDGMSKFRPGFLMRPGRVGLASLAQKLGAELDALAELKCVMTERNFMVAAHLACVCE